MKHEHWIDLALTEAYKARGQTHPNPTVGAVLVKANRLLAKGYHKGAGNPHAEIVALERLSSPTLAKGATLYVTLEPCSTQGRTPPCTDAIIRSGIKRVVFGATDPNPEHAGRAKHLLTAAGIEVISGVLEERCSNLNRAWNHWIVTKLPYVTAKVGMSLDGRIDSPPHHRWITSEAARRDAMRLRSEVDAILIGGKTLRTDNPQLTLRGPQARDRKQPLRVIWSQSKNHSKNATVFTDAHRDRTLVLKTDSLAKALQVLGEREIVHVLIEGGGTVIGHALDHSLIHEICFYIAPALQCGFVPAIGGNGCPSNAAATQLHSVEYTKIGSNIRVRGLINR